MREYILPIFGLLIKFDPTLLDTLKPTLEQHETRIAAFLEDYTVDSDWQELLTKESEQAHNIINPKPAAAEHEIQSNESSASDEEELEVEQPKVEAKVQ